MSTLDEIMVRYGSDKSSRGSEPWMWSQDYCRRTYEGLFDPIRDRALTLLELGWGEWDPVRRNHSNPDNGGRSARAWAEYFPNATIVSVELAEKHFHDSDQWPHIHLFDRTDATDREALSAIHDELGDFDIVIDDASHISSKTITSFKILWPHLKPGGLYIVEDLHSSYHDWYFGKGEADRDPDTAVPTAMQFFKRLADEAFFRGEALRGPLVKGQRTTDWDCFPRRHWLGYRIESIAFCAPQLIVIRKKT